MVRDYQTISDNVSALLSSQFLYHEAMIEECKGGYLPYKDLKVAHGRCKYTAIKHFHLNEKTIDEEHSIQFLHMLDDLISTSFNVFVSANDFKQDEKGKKKVQTPSVAKTLLTQPADKLKTVVTSVLRDIRSNFFSERPNAVFPTSPGPVQIIEAVEEDYSFKLNVDFLEKILLDPKVADKKVSVISVAGGFRKGKSFLLNFFLRYLTHQTGSGTGSSEDNWLDAEENLLGFSWRGGAERDTSGILIWSEPFIVKDRNGEEIVVLLMDTQGTFDSQNTYKNNATIFALSMMISSLQIYNLSHNIQEDDLQHLHLFTEYGLLALEDNVNSKPFQSLLFVVRDWSYPYEAEYGSQGGQRVLEKRLIINEGQHPQLQQLRRHIRESFDDIQCYLMPHPGLEVATSPMFMGELKDINDEFQQHLRALVPRLLDANNVVVKRINGEPVTCRELTACFKAYMKIIHGDGLPEPMTMLDATAEANNLAAVASARAIYVKSMEEACGGDKAYMHTADLADVHGRCKSEAIRHFKVTKKMGGSGLSMQFLKKLDDDICVAFESFVRANDAKNPFRTMRTPAVLVCLMVANYFFREIFQLFGLDYIASFFSLVFLLAIFLLSSWSYARYSGKMRDFGQKIDQLVEWSWENLWKHIFTSSVGPAAPAMTI